MDAYLPPYEPRQVLDPAEPVSIGAMVGPEAFMEVRYLAHAKQRQALELIPAWAGEFKRIFGRASGGLTHTYRLDDAETVVVALGSVLGTIKDTVDEMREQGVKIGVLGITCFRPWPTRRGARGARGREARGGAGEEPRRGPRRHRLEQRLGLLPRLGRRRVHRDRGTRRARDHARLAAPRVRAGAGRGRLEPLTFLDLDHALVDRVLAREREHRRSGPIAEGILRDLGVVAAKIG